MLTLSADVRLLGLQGRVGFVFSANRFPPLSLSLSLSRAIYALIVLLKALYTQSEWNKLSVFECSLLLLFRVLLPSKSDSSGSSSRHH